MSYNPTISAARRAAKQIARETGAPYQASLDTVARKAGKSDWNDYLAEPREIPVDDGDDLYINGPEHRDNMKNMWIAGLAVLPSFMVLPVATMNGDDIALAIQERQWFGHVMWTALQATAVGMAVLLAALMMGTMFFDMLAVHPDVVEIGRDGKRDRHTSEDLCHQAIGLATLALIVAFVTRDHPRAHLTATAAAAAVAIVAGGVSLLMRSRRAKRVLALVSANGMVAAGFLALSVMPR